MKFYSKLEINVISILISIIICLFIFEYIPKLYQETKVYIYYKMQPNLVKEYEEENST